MKIPILLLLGLSPFAHAAGKSDHCLDANHEFVGKDLMLQGDDPVIFVLKNTSNSALVLNHSGTGEGMEAGWASQVKPGHMSALLLHGGNFRLTCSTTVTNFFARQPCESAVEACLLMGATLPANADGTFWLAENLDHDDLMSKLRSRGVVLPGSEP